MESFIKRLLEVLKKKSMSASQFAEKIGVQRSSVSHILSGRNKQCLINNFDQPFMVSIYLKVLHCAAFFLCPTDQV